MFSPTRLTQQEFDAVKHIWSTTLMRKVQPVDVLQKLRGAGLIDQRLGGDVITDKGRAALRQRRSPF
ncbi:hypothetical protein [Terricaulis sp.]|uniref:hypothetical protein n=1 Tax=Terricaulis sp. TaxID=2768686 RepID=UPI0037832CD6